MSEPTPGEMYYTIPEVAERLKVTPQAIYKWIRDGRLATVYVGSDRRITESAIIAFVKESTQRQRQRVDSEDTIEDELLIPGLAAQPEFAL